MFNGSNCDLKAQLSGILAEPLNPRESSYVLSLQSIPLLVTLYERIYELYKIVEK